MRLQIIPRDEANGHYDICLEDIIDGNYNKGRAYRIRGSKDDQVVFALKPDGRGETTHEFPSVHSALHWIIATHIKVP